MHIFVNESKRKRSSSLKNSAPHQAKRDDGVTMRFQMHFSLVMKTSESKVFYLSEKRVLRISETSTKEQP